MSKGYRDGAFALGLVVGGGIALNLFLWLDYRARNKIHNHSGGSQDAQYSEVGGYWDGFVGTFISPSDTLAQWIMAFFTIAATGVLVLTLRSANKTNIAAVNASKAALEANDILRAEQRSWVIVKPPNRCTLGSSGRLVELKFDIELINRGKTPAFGVRSYFDYVPAQNFGIVDEAFSVFLDMSKAKAMSELPYHEEERIIFPNDEARRIDTKRFKFLPAGGRGMFIFSAVLYLRGDGKKLGWDAHVYKVGTVPLSEVDDGGQVYELSEVSDYHRIK